MPLWKPSMKLAAMSLGAGNTIGSTSARRAAPSQRAIRSKKTAAGSQAVRALARRADKKVTPRGSYMKRPKAAATITQLPRQGPLGGRGGRPRLGERARPDWSAAQRTAVGAGAETSVSIRGVEAPPQSGKKCRKPLFF